ncbi:response regulator [Burkholderia pseudomallei MSHR435]|nr:response regulator [Burkholderia pseudomallei MSHR435]
MWPVSTIAQSSGASSRPPTRKRATASTGFCVADSPMRGSLRPTSASSRSSDSARWLPRLAFASAWISSTITVRVLASMRRPDSDDSSTYSDSGVVTRMCGACLRCATRSAWVVSPVRTAVRICGTGSPRRAISAAMPASGASRFT